MQIVFEGRENAPSNLICEAEIQFDVSVLPGAGLNC